MNISDYLFIVLLRMCNIGLLSTFSCYSWMGLAGRKTKQRIGADPRNLSWADDASKFGSAYLAKFGWDSSKGLGVAGDGRTTHVKVQQKLDMMGIGAAHMHDPNGIAWKQNRDFEDLLKRLNERTGGEGNGGEEEEGTKVEGFVSAVESGKKDEKETDKKKKDKEGKKSKRKRKDKDDTEHKTKKRRNSADEGEESIPKASETPQPVIPRHRAHRARAIAAKKMLSSSATALSEILGIAPTPSSSITPSGSATPQGQLTTVDDDIVGERITTSTKSVADYFKEKLLSKSSGQSGSMTPDTPDDAYDTPRGGLGSSRFKMDSGETTLNDGMSKFASLMSSTFLAAASSAASAPSIPPNNQEKAETDDGDRSRKQKKDKKDKKKQDKGTKYHGSEQPEEQARKEKKRRKKEE